MARSGARYPTELELQILKVLWCEKSCSVREVREALAEAGRELAHTTVVTMLHTMTDKEFVHRDRINAKSYRFTARVSEESVSTGMLGDLLQRVFDGSAAGLVLNLLESEHVDEEEHKALRRLINRRRKES